MSDDTTRPYRPRLSDELEAAIKAAAALASITPLDYWNTVVTPLVQDDLRQRLEVLGMGTDATVPMPTATARPGALDAQ